MPNIDVQSSRSDEERSVGSDDLDTLQRYGQSGWEVDHAVAHGENQNDLLFVFKRMTRHE
jgi:hypothetical protein